MHVCKKYPGVLGGDAVVVANLQKQQQKAGHKVAIVTSNCAEVKSGSRIYKPGLKDTSAGLDVITLRRLISLVILGFRMFVILKKERPEVIHTHSIDMAFFVSFSARFYHIPLVHTFHIVTFYDTEQSLIRRKTEVRLAKMAKLNAITAPNEYDVGKLRNAGLEQSVLLANGVDLAFWKQSRREKPSKTFVFLAIGRLEKQKGYEYLIRAAAMLRSHSSNLFHIYIVGEGSEQERLQDLIQTLNVENEVTLAGRKSMDEVRVLLERADAAVFPSLYETTPITLLEAWATATPVIMTTVGILRGVPADFNAAYIVQSKDEQALVRAMTQCMEDENRQEIAINGYEEAKKYAWPFISQTAEAIYRGVQ